MTLDTTAAGANVPDDVENYPVAVLLDKNPGPPITVSIWALGYSYPIRSYETIIAKGDTSWTLQRVQYGPGGGLRRSPARVIKPACGRLVTICARTISPGRGSSRERGCTSWWCSRSRA